MTHRKAVKHAHRADPNLDSLTGSPSLRLMVRGLDIWLPSWLARTAPKSALGARHLIIAVCDHYEPLQKGDKPDALRRVARWHEDFPRMTRDLRDSNGETPRHTFFYPVEKYDADILEAIAGICRSTACELEIHLHHDNDTSDNLRRTLSEAVTRLESHGALAVDPEGATRFGFIHGNWALDHSHPSGRFCGVPDELAILREAGCYADFTLPSAPDRAQTRTINSIYYAREDGAPKSHDRGRPITADRQHTPAGKDELLIVQGVLGLNWGRRKFGILPRIENSDLTAANPPTLERLQFWMDCHVSVAGRPNWTFIKLHTHGARWDNLEMILGEPMRRFHQSLAELAKRDPSLRFHYVSAREMVNLVHAAEAGHSGDPGQFRDFRYRLRTWKPAAERIAGS